MSNDTQETIFQFIKAYIVKHHYPPTRREIRTGCGISSNSVVSYHLRNLQDAGRLNVVQDVARGIVLVEEAEAVS